MITPATELQITTSIHFLLTVIEHKVSGGNFQGTSFKYILNQKGFRLSLLMTEDNT